MRSPLTRCTNRRSAAWGTALAAVLMLLVVTRTAEPVASAPVTTVTQLDNGLTLAVEERPAATAAGVALAVRMGARDDRAGREGEIALLARAMYSGTASRPSTDLLTKEIEGSGGSIALNVDGDFTHIVSQVPGNDIDLVVDVLGDMLNNPRMGVLDISQAAESLDEVIAFPEALTTLLWRDHPAGRAASGTTRSLNRVTYSDLMMLRERYLGAQNIVLAIAGPISAERALQLVQTKMGSLPAGERRPLSRAAASAPQAVRRTVSGTGELATITMGFAGPGWGALDAPAFNMISLLLTGADGLLFDDIRSRHGLARDVDATAFLISDAGALFALARVQPDNVDTTIDRILDIFAGLRNSPLSEDELRARYERAAGALAVDRAASRTRALEMAGLLVTGRDLEWSNRTIEALASVTPGDVQEAARRYLTPDRSVIIVRSPSPRR